VLGHLSLPHPVSVLGNPERFSEQFDKGKLSPASVTIGPLSPREHMVAEKVSVVYEETEEVMYMNQLEIKEAEECVLKDGCSCPGQIG
jgi:hypothetical protein